MIQILNNKDKQSIGPRLLPVKSKTHIQADKNHTNKWTQKDSPKNKQKDYKLTQQKKYEKNDMIV